MSSHRFVSSWHHVAVALCALAVAACGGSKKDVDESVPVVLGQAGPGDAGGYFPMQIGNTWSFAATVTESGQGSRTFHSTIRSTGQRTVAGATATVFQATNGDGFGSTEESVLVSDPAGIAEYGSSNVAGLPGGLGAYWLVRFPLQAGASFVQIDKTALDVGQDLDGDGNNETADVRSVVTVVGFETVTVPAGTFASCARVQASVDLSVYATGLHRRASGKVLQTVWYAPGLGWVKLAEDVTIEGEPTESDQLELAGYDVNGVTGGTIWSEVRPDRIELTPGAVEIGVTGTASVAAAAWSGSTRLGNVSLTWVTENPAVATVSSNGVVTGVAEGTTAVYASASGTESNRVTVHVLTGRILSLATNDMIYDPGRARIYASVPSRQGTAGNSIAVIDPASGTVAATMPAGSEPNKLALSRDGRYLYVALDGAARVARFDLTAPGGPVEDLTFTLGADAFFGPYYVEDMDVMPGAPGTVAISRRYGSVSPRHAGVAIFDGAVQRPTATPGHTGSNVIEFSDDPSRLYGLNTETTEFGFRRMSVTTTGVAVDQPVVTLATGFGSDMKYAGGMIYTTSGNVLDAATATLTGTFSGLGYAVVEPDLEHRVVFFVSQPTPGAARWALRTFDATTFVPVASRSIEVGAGYPGDLVRWGARGLAYRSSDWVAFVDDLPGVP